MRESLRNLTIVILVYTLFLSLLGCGGTSDSGDNVVKGFNQLRESTFVVAASNASAEVLAGADYTCDGTADNVQIQAALDAIAALTGSPGGTVRLSEGAFTNSGTLIMRSNIILEGSGWGTTITRLTDNNILHIDGADDTIIRNIHFRGYAASSGATQMEASGIVIGENNNSDRVLIQGCKFSRNLQVGVYVLSKSSYATITNCFIDQTQKSGIQSSGFHTLISDNQVIGRGGTVGDNQISIVGGWWNVIKGNEIRNGQNGIEIRLARYCSFINNTIRGPYEDGIRLGGVGGTSDLVINCLIQGNQITDCGEKGIWANWDTDKQIQGLTIDNNHIINSKENGIRIESSVSGGANDEIKITNNIIQNSGSETAQVSGLRLDNSRYNIITGNIIFDTSDAGTRTQNWGIAQSSTAAAPNIIRNNNLANNGTGTVSSPYDSVFDHTILTQEFTLSDAATYQEIFHANMDSTIQSYTIVYTNTSSADAGVAINIGKYNDNMAVDVDYFDTVTSLTNKGIGAKNLYHGGNFTNQAISEGDTVVFGTAGGKAGAGTIMAVIQIASTKE